MDLLDILGAMGIAIAWCGEMTHSALWLSEDRVMVLNAHVPHPELLAAVYELLFYGRAGADD